MSKNNIYKLLLVTHVLYFIVWAVSQQLIVASDADGIYFITVKGKVIWDKMTEQLAFQSLSSASMFIVLLLFNIDEHKLKF